MKLKIVVLIVPFLWTIANTYRILGILPQPGKSHTDFFEPLLIGLAAKGHDVTVISHFPQKTPLPRYTDIDISNGTKPLINWLDINEFKTPGLQKYVTIILMATFARSVCEEGLSQPNLQNFIRSEPKFDIIITEFFNTRCFLGLVHRFNAPLIGLSSSTMMSWHDTSMGYPSNPAYIPNNLLAVSDRMSFFERVENTFFYVYMHVLVKLLIDIPDNWSARKYIGQDLPPLDDIAANTSLMITNTHFTYTTPRPMIPGYIEAGGLHLGKPKTLPQNIEKWINESTHGVIYFSLGSMIKGHTFPEEKRQMFLKAFARLPQRVLWKWETEMPGKPDNVMIQKWMPQFDILSHPNVKAFIAHGGLLGTTEAVHCGVPMVIMPQFGDQFTNAKAVKASGGGVILDFHSLDEESIYNALKKVLDPSFNKKAKELSARFRDRPLPPLDTAIYWVEYVARHGGAPHMRTAAVGMPFYKYLLLDVVAFLAAVLFLTVYISYRLTKAVFRKIFKASPTTKKVKKS